MRGERFVPAAEKRAFLFEASGNSSVEGRKVRAGGVEEGILV